MLARLRSWWAGRSRLERLLVAVGVPVAAIAALWSARQDRRRKAEAAEDAEGGSGAEATVTRTAAAPNVINAGAPGVGTSDLASFTEAFSGEIGALEDSLAGLEKQFGDTATERAKRDAEQAEELDRLRGELEEREREGEERDDGGGGPVTIQPVGDPVPLDEIRKTIREAVQRPSESPKRRSAKERLEKQVKADPDAQLREAIRQIFREERLDQPSSARLNRLVVEVKGGRTLADIRKGLEEFKRNRPELGIPI